MSFKIKTKQKIEKTKGEYKVQIGSDVRYFKNKQEMNKWLRSEPILYHYQYE